jgi:hypothetical protein
LNYLDELKQKAAFNSEKNDLEIGILTNERLKTKKAYEEGIKL